MTFHAPGTGDTMRAVFTSQDELNRIMSERNAFTDLLDFKHEPRRYTRREKLSLRTHSLRERIALRIAPWLEDESW